MALIKCKECGKEISNDAKICPHCGKKTAKPPAFLIIICVTFLVFLVGTALDQASQMDEDFSAEEYEEVEDVEILQDNFCNIGWGVRGVCGLAINNTNKKLSYVQIEINLYNKEGTHVGSTIANTNNLEPQNKWRFQAPVLEHNVASYKIMGITSL